MEYMIVSPNPSNPESDEKFIDDIQLFIHSMRESFQSVYVDKTVNGRMYDCGFYLADDSEQEIDCYISAEGSLILLYAGTVADLIAFSLWVREQIQDNIPLQLLSVSDDTNLLLNSNTTEFDIKSVIR